MTERIGPDEQGGTPPEGTPAEERLEWLRADRDAGYIEGGTEELRIIAAASGSSAEDEQPLTESQKRAAERLEEREADERKKEKALEYVRKLNVSRVPGKRPGRRRSTDR